MIKPMLASDADLKKLTFPCVIQPKIDGCRALNTDGVLTGRSLKKHRNPYVTDMYSNVLCAGFDGEMIVGNDPTKPALCRDTSSALSRMTGEPSTTWWLFDYITEQTQQMAYAARYSMLKDKVERLKDKHDSLCINSLRVVTSVYCADMRQLLDQEAIWLDAGYEGLIYRGIGVLHKQGRSTNREGGLLRIKRFAEAEAIVRFVTEGQENGNEAQENELGQTFRTSHQENMAANGQVGNLICEVLEDFIDDSGATLMKQRQVITVAAGCLDVRQRKYYFENQGDIVGQVIKFKFFPKGIKDKPRFPTFQSFRSEEDM